jgi:hypothetical protein
LRKERKVNISASSSYVVWERVGVGVTWDVGIGGRSR